MLPQASNTTPFSGDTGPRSPVQQMLVWLDTNWHCAGAVAGIFYLLALPLHRNWTAASLLLALQLPFYVLHQMEEHVHDRFRRAINADLGGGLDVLPHRAVVVINVLGVWAVEWVALYLAVFVHPGFAVLALALAIVNAVTHVAASVATRSYNPGLITSLLLLLPGGLLGMRFYAEAHLLARSLTLGCFAVVLVEHAFIIADVLRRKARLSRDLHAT